MYGIVSVLLVGVEGKQPYLHVLKAEIGYVRVPAHL